MLGQRGLALTPGQLKDEVFIPGREGSLQLEMVAAARRRVLGLKQENRKLQSKIEEIRLVDRAKCMLIQYLSMTESQAHRYIEKQAMDRRVTRGEVARSILGLYDP